MGQTTTIEWAEATHNFWQGCRKVSPGCKNCYAERLMGEEKFKVVRKADYAAFHAPYRWRKPRSVFTCSMSDFFIEEADAWRRAAWDVIEDTPQHTYMILTKRTERIQQCLPSSSAWLWPLVWLGASVENQYWADVRLPQLLAMPAVKHFVSCEPLLGPIDLSAYLPDLDWIITGGESGPDRRPFDKAWASAILRQCQEAKVPFFFKQGSGLRPGQDRELEGKLWEETPSKG